MGLRRAWSCDVCTASVVGEKTRVCRPGGNRPQECGDLCGGLGRLPAIGAGAVEPAVDGDADEAGAGVLRDQGSSALLVAARAVQHETDHLNGLLFIDRMEKKMKLELQPELDDLQAQTKAALKKK